MDLPKIKIGKVEYYELTCYWCKKKFKRRVNQVNFRPHWHFFCSQKCSWTYNSQSKSLDKQLADAAIVKYRKWNGLKWN